MPLYEFRCTGCGHVFEELILRRGDLEEVVCPACQAKETEQLLSSFASGTSSSDGGGGSGQRRCSPSSFS
jgi:putative FmdB family regulatory protein